MANIIKLKYGSGLPSNGSLATGEVGLDLTNKIIYTSTNGTDIVEMAGGTVEWDNIVNIPNEIDVIINGGNPDYVDIKALAEQVEKNTGDISALKTWQEAASADIAKLKEDVAKNASDISTNAENIGKNAINISGNTDAIGALDGRVEQNEDDIEAIKAQLDKELTGLVLAGTYSAASNQITSVMSNAASAGFQENQPLNAYLGDQYAGYYFIVDEAGTLANTGSPARADGDAAFVGDWLVSDGPHWLHFNFSTESTVWGTISGDINEQEDLQNQFATKLGVDDTIDGGTYS